MFKHFEAFPQPTEDFRTYEHACRVMAAYNATYTNEPFTILKSAIGKPIIEASFIFKLGTVNGTDVMYIGRLDTGIENKDGTWSQDHKTTFQFGQSFDDDMAMNGGQLGYVFALWQILGVRPQGYIIDAVRVRKPSRKAEYEGIAPVDSEDFKRIPFNVSEDNLAEWREDVLCIVQNIFLAYDHGFYPRHRKHCVTKYGRCDFYDVCSLPRASRDGVLNSNLYETNEWSPLNKQNNESQTT
jgi:hypothetical protein